MSTQRASKERKRIPRDYSLDRVKFCKNERWQNREKQKMQPLPRT